MGDDLRGWGCEETGGVGGNGVEAQGGDTIRRGDVQGGRSASPQNNGTRMKEEKRGAGAGTKPRKSLAEVLGGGHSGWRKLGARDSMQTTGGRVRWDQKGRQRQRWTPLPHRGEGIVSPSLVHAGGLTRKEGELRVGVGAGTPATRTGERGAMDKQSRRNRGHWRAGVTKGQASREVMSGDGQPRSYRMTKDVRAGGNKESIHNKYQVSMKAKESTARFGPRAVKDDNTQEKNSTGAPKKTTAARRGTEMAHQYHAEGVEKRSGKARSQESKHEAEQMSNEMFRRVSCIRGGPTPANGVEGRDWTLTRRAISGSTLNSRNGLLVWASHSGGGQGGDVADKIHPQYRAQGMLGRGLCFWISSALLVGRGKPELRAMAHTKNIHLEIFLVGSELGPTRTRTEEISNEAVERD
ncbi:unnamed protein product [Prunus armeniaca]|uniref:Uncharacterized protein n=1 Tax=Prunus armeniaca TaxID=36596 RepID=A0A6J5WPH6_PRUAR|nr:unnamed protein product [Prunus armeniaca]